MDEIREPNRRCLSVIMPVYNEATTVSQIIRRVLQQACVQELIIVDDCSSDKTLEVLRKIAATDDRIRLFNHEVNQGKGAALRTGFKEARADIVII
jgi:glycosyltransferase involved in cell wall biosynthesis